MGALKPKGIRLHGQHIKKLSERIYEREGGMCAVCHRYVPEGTKPHHEPPKSRGGQDIAENMILICNDCHFQRHNGRIREIQRKCEDYLNEL